MALPGFAIDPHAASTCKRPEYPQRAQKSEQDGATVLAFLVGTDGTVKDSAILSSAGSRDLDRAAALALSRCTFTREPDDDKAVDLWIRMIYVWGFTDDPTMLNAKQRTALAASRGSVAARYHLSVLMWSTAKTDTDRAQALTVLRSAAELGHAHAQYELGQRHEKGDGVKLDRDEAERWYRQSAAQGDPLARQRLTLGILGS